MFDTPKFNKPKRRSVFALVKSFWAFDGEGDGGAPAAPPSEAPSASYEAVTTGESTRSAEIPSSVSEAPAPTPGVNWNEAVPAEYRDKPYMQNVLKSADPMTELLKQFDGLQTKLGQRPSAVPGPDATDEDWEKFYETTRPKTADEYDIKPLELGEDKKHLAEFINENRDDASIQELKTMMHKHGLSKRQAEALAKDYDTWFANKLEGEFKTQKEAGEKLNADFDQMTKEVFGADIEKALLQGRKYIDMYMPESVKKYKEALPNEAAIIIAAMAKNVFEKYEKGDKFDAPSATSGASEQELRQEMRQLMALPAASNKFHEDHASVQAQINDITDQIVKLRKQK